MTLQVSGHIVPLIPNIHLFHKGTRFLLVSHSPNVLCLSKATSILMLTLEKTTHKGIIRYWDLTSLAEQVPSTQFRHDWVTSGRTSHPGTLLKKSKHNLKIGLVNVQQYSRVVGPEHVNVKIRLVNIQRYSRVVRPKHSNQAGLGVKW